MSGCLGLYYNRLLDAKYVIMYSHKCIGIKEKRMNTIIMGFDGVSNFHSSRSCCRRFPHELGSVVPAALSYSILWYLTV